LLEHLAANDPQLTELYNVPPSVGMRELATALALNTTLTYLGLRDRGLVAADAHELAGALERNKTLATTASGPTALATWLERWTGTRHLRRST
jgi:hypothetical protein